MVLAPLDDPQHTLDAIAFNVSEDEWPAPESTEIEIVYRLQTNEFRGQFTLQLLVSHLIGCH